MSLQNSGSAVSGDDLTFDNTNVLCFDRGTFIETKDGPMVVEELRPGILVRTLSNGFQPLRLVLKKRLNKKALARNEKLRPVRICKGALATNVPNRDLCVSRQHRILAKSAICNRMFGIQDALIAGIKLTNLPRIFVDYEVDTVEYHHLVFDNHEVIFANGAAAESFYPGPKALKALTPEAYEEITTLFPFLMQPDRHCETAALIPDNKRQKTLVERHLKNRKPLQEMLESVAF